MKNVNKSYEYFNLVHGAIRLCSWNVGSHRHKNVLYYYENKKST